MQVQGKARFYQQNSAIGKEISTCFKDKGTSSPTRDVARMGERLELRIQWRP
jgi:hypothetical protein